MHVLPPSRNTFALLGLTLMCHRAHIPELNMRPSPLKTPLAALRQFLRSKTPHSNLGLREFAKKVGCKQSALQNAELGRRPLGDELALRISEKTGVSVSWLMGAKPGATIMGRNGEEYSVETFRAAQAGKAIAPLFQKTIDERTIARDVTYLAGDIFNLLSHVAKTKAPLEYEIISGKIGRYIREGFSQNGAPPFDLAWINTLGSYLKAGLSAMESDLVLTQSDDGSLLEAAARVSPDGHRALEATKVAKLDQESKRVAVAKTRRVKQPRPSAQSSKKPAAAESSKKPKRPSA